MSNPLTSAASRQGAPVPTTTAPTVSPTPAPSSPSLTLSGPTLTPYENSDVHVHDLENQIAQLTAERDGNRALVASAADLRMQRNVLIVVAGALAVMWWMK